MKNERTLILIIISTLLLTSLLTLLLYSENGRSEKERSNNVGNKIAGGATLYGLHCQNCHGIRGEGIGQLGPPLSDNHFFSDRLTEVGWQTTLEQYITTTTKHGRMMGTRPIYAGNGSTAVMPPWHKESGGPLRSDQVNSIAFFILNWEATATGSVVLEELHLTEGQNLNDFSDKGKNTFKQHCNRCHSFKDISTLEINGPELTNIRFVIIGDKEDMQPEEYIRESVLIPTVQLSPGYEKLAEQEPCGAVMTDSELSAVTDFLLQ